MVKLTIPRKLLVTTIRNAKTAAPGRTARAGSEGVRIEVRGDKAAFRASNGDSAIQQVVSVTNGEDGVVFVPARQLEDFAQRMPEGSLTLEEANGRLTMSVGKVVMHLNLLAVDTAPVVTFPSGDGISIPAKEFANALRQVAVAASSDDSRIVLTGILLEAREAGLRLVATDSYRLAVRDIPGVSGLPEGTSIVAPAAALDAVSRIIEASETVTVRLMETSVGFEIPGVKVVLRLIDAAYPNYNSVLQNDASTTAVVDREALMGALLRAEAATRNSTPIVRLTFSPDEKKVDVSAAGSVGQGAQEEISISGTGAALTVSANPGFMATAVNQILTDNVKICFSGPLRPVLVTGEDANADLRYIVMPSRA